jgi:hypothetical protein
MFVTMQYHPKYWMSNYKNYVRDTNFWLPYTRKEGEEMKREHVNKEKLIT